MIVENDNLLTRRRLCRRFHDVLRQGLLPPQQPPGPRRRKRHQARRSVRSPSQEGTVRVQLGSRSVGMRICEKQLWKVIDDIEKTEVREDDIAEFLPSIYRKLDWLDKEDIIRRVVTREFGRFVEYYSNAPEPEAVIERGQRTKDNRQRAKGEEGPRKRREKGEGPRKAEKGYVRFFVNRGKRDGFYASQIIDLVNRHVRTNVFSITLLFFFHYLF